MTRDEQVDRLTSAGVIVVVRLKDSSKAELLAEALIAGGVRAIEITMTTPGALRIIENLAVRFGGDAMIGVGSVLSAQIAKEAINAGATFLVSPIGRTELVPICHGRDVPVMLGAYTPTEAQTAHESGADFVKLFPAEGLGPVYIKSLLAPLPHLKLVPTGGIDLNNIQKFRLAGCKAVGVGSSLVSAEWLAKADWAQLQAVSRAYIENWNSI